MPSSSAVEKTALYWRFWWLSLGWLGIVGLVTVSLMPLPVGPSVSYGDKLGHFLVYGLLMLWFVQFYGRAKHLILGLFLIGLGVLLEIAQGQTGYRSFEYYDMLANSLGVLTSYVLAATPLSAGLVSLEHLFLRN